MHVALPKSRPAEKLPPGDQRLGFLAAGRDPDRGYLGGYLITTARGRPLEFHYTSPVKPSATHRILYGPELEPYIYGELIGANLVRQSNMEPMFLITDQPLVMNQRPASSCPIVCVQADAQIPDASKASAAGLISHPNYPQDKEALDKWLSDVSLSINLDEPFKRIWEALREVLSGDEKREAA